MPRRSTQSSTGTLFLPSRLAQVAPLKLAIALTLATALFLAPALWNGFPLVYYDSVDYLQMPFTWQMPVYRTAGYGLVTIAGRLAHSLWIIPLLQSALAAYVLYEALRRFLPRQPEAVLVPIAGLLLLTSGLPWFTSELMPDAFTGILVLSFALLVCDDGLLGPARRIGLTAILALAIAVHTSHAALAGGLLLSALMVSLAAPGLWPGLRSRLKLPLMAFLIGIALAASANAVVTGRFFLLQDNAVLTLGLFVEDGLAETYLDHACSKPRPKLDLCIARHRLPHNANMFLWHDHDFNRLGGWTGTGMREEARQIVRGAIKSYPLTYLWDSVKLTAQQLAMLRTADGVAPMRYLIGDAIARHYPKESAAFLAAHQQHGTNFDALNMVQVPLLWLASAALPLLLWLAWRRRDPDAVLLLGIMTLAFLGNAFVCGALSNPNDRYQNRIAWLAILAVVISLGRWYRRDRSVPAPNFPRDRVP
ncbi:hypothetical protein [Hypericibacter sp.]|uniref:hypothetical protein n=1 Tax=Hypericibacter sp. TaxID=2705401 RepID=UPI003D6D930C